MAQWRNKINIKEYLSDDQSDSMVVLLIEKLIPQLEKIYEKEKKIMFLSDCFIEELEEIIENFKLVKNCIETNEDSEEHGFDNWREAFNEYLEQLYDLGDTLTIKRDFFNDEKFLWIG